jgi:hypothetical protein
MHQQLLRLRPIFIRRRCGVLRFDAPFYGFTFPREYLNLPMPAADPRLNAVLRKHAEVMLAELPRAQNLTDQGPTCSILPATNPVAHWAIEEPFIDS